MGKLQKRMSVLLSVLKGIIVHGCFAAKHDVIFMLHAIVMQVEASFGVIPAATDSALPLP
jgi:hypothetical protein